MATLTIYGEASDGYVQSSDPVYSNARAGTGTSAVDNTSIGLYTGQTFITVYRCYQGFIQYNTSAIGETAAITSVSELLYLYNDLSDADFTIEVRSVDWGASLEVSDFVAGVKLGSYTLLSSKTSDTYASGYNEFSSSSSFISAINKTGNTKIMHSSNRQRLGNTPTQREYVRWYSADQTGTDQDPKLVITYTVPVSQYVNIGGVWKNVAGIYVNIGGAWKTASGVYSNIGGTWKS